MHHEHLLKVAEGVEWDNVHLNARITIQHHFKKQNVSLKQQQRESVKALAKRGLNCGAIPMNLRKAGVTVEEKNISRIGLQECVLEHAKMPTNHRPTKKACQPQDATSCICT